MINVTEFERVIGRRVVRKPNFAFGTFSFESFTVHHGAARMARISTSTGSSKKVPAKLGDTCSVRADGLCIGCLSQWAEVGRENSKMQEFFCTTLYTS